MRNLNPVIPDFNPFEPPADFVAWILSINKSWRDKISYAPYNEYVAQALRWKEENIHIEDYEEGTAAYIDCIKSEKKRLQQSSLYYMERYNYYKEAKAEGGRLKTTTSEAQKVICFLIDMGVGLAIAKSRGIRASSTFLPVAGIKAKVTKNIYLKYICNSEKKVKSLFDDKLKFSAQNDPVWMQPNVGSDRRDGIEYFIHVGKGDRRGLNSKTLIAPPSNDALIGDNPDVVLIDEAPSIPKLDVMLKEGIPALYTTDPITEVRTMTKQLIVWGSSQYEDEKEVQVSDAFEQWWKSLAEQYVKGEFGAGIVPLFFDCFSVPGFNTSEYERLKIAYEVDKSEANLIRFRKHYPTCPDDVFLKNADTLIPFDTIQGYIDKIYLHIKNKELQVVKGYFMPIYDRSQPLPEGVGSPFKITGAEFIPVGDGGESQATVTIFNHPDRDWINRYYQGTDPIVGQGGHSKFASAIFDNCEKNYEGGPPHGKTIQAILNCRHSDYKKDYEQSYLMHLYYSNPARGHFIPELLEINVGNEYNTYCEIMKYGYNMITNLELPDYLQCGEQIVGINKKSVNKDRILNKTYELMSNYGDRIMIEEFWTQAKSYVRHSNKKGFNDSFSPSDKYSFDDILDGSTYAYIASLCGSQKPVNVNNNQDKAKVHRRKVMRNGQMVYEEVRTR